MKLYNKLYSYTPAHCISNVKACCCIKILTRYVSHVILAYNKVGSSVCQEAEYESGLTCIGDALKVKHENKERAKARRQEQASSSGHPHPEARLCWRSPRFSRFIRDQPAEDARLSEELGAYSLIAGDGGKKANNNIRAHPGITLAAQLNDTAISR